MGQGSLDIFKTTMPSSRVADFYLGGLDGSIFMDFNLNQDGCLILRRISFDGYGCCELKRDVIPLSKTESQLFIDEYKSEGLNQETMAKLVNKAIKSNADLIWKDALLEYGLIEME